MKLYIVGVHLNKRIAAGNLGFSSYVPVYVQAITCQDAETKATEFFQRRSWLQVLETTCKEAPAQHPDFMQGLSVKYIF